MERVTLTGLEIVVRVLQKSTFLRTVHNVNSDYSTVRWCAGEHRGLAQHYIILGPI